MTSRSPQPGDRVRVTIDYTVQSNGHYVGKSIAHEDYVTIEVLEPVDDPSKDPVGTVRQFDDGRVIALTDSVDEHPWHGIINANTVFSHEYVSSDTRVIGAVPGTPAAEAQTPPPDSCPACGSTSPSVSRGPINCPDPWHAPTSREPREFRSDGPEPPVDVDVLICVDVPRMLRGTPYLKRLPESSGWSWVAHPGQTVSVEWGHSRWPISSQVFSGEFREVLA